MPDIAFDRCEQRALQIGAVDHPVGRAVSRLRSQRHDRDVAAGTAGAQPDGLGNDDRRLDAFGEAECDQHARGVGGKLDAGAGLLEPLRLIEQSDREALPRDRQRRRQSADARSGDQDGRGHAAMPWFRPSPGREGRIPVDAPRRGDSVGSKR